MAADDIPPDDMQAEIEMAAEESLGRPLAGTALERLAALQKRISYLEHELGLTDNLEEPYRSAMISRTKADLAEARRQLAAWRAQQDSRN